MQWLEIGWRCGVQGPVGNVMPNQVVAELLAGGRRNERLRSGEASRAKRRGVERGVDKPGSVVGGRVITG